MTNSERYCAPGSSARICQTWGSSPMTGGQQQWWVAKRILKATFIYALEKVQNWGFCSPKLKNFQVFWRQFEICSFVDEPAFSESKPCKMSGRLFTNKTGKFPQCRGSLPWKGRGMAMTPCPPPGTPCCTASFGGKMAVFPFRTGCEFWKA